MAMLKRSMIGSATLHVAVIAAASLAWPHTLDFSDEPSPVLPVELVSVAEVSNIAPTVAEPPKSTSCTGGPLWTSSEDPDQTTDQMASPRRRRFCSLRGLAHRA